MPVRNIIRIDEELCDGCGNCVPACEEGALQIIDGKARLVKEIYCDGLGACLGECPQGALTIEQREADGFDPEAVERHLTGQDAAGTTPEPAPEKLACGCPGSAMRTFAPGKPATAPVSNAKRRSAPSATGGASALRHWPVQLMLVPVGAPFVRDADLLICADCVPFTVPDFHERYLEGRSLVVACPKLDDLDLYRRKLKDMFAASRPRSVTVLRMEVPCCGGLTQAVLEARDTSVPELDVEIHTLGIRGGAHVENAPGVREQTERSAS